MVDQLPLDAVSLPQSGEGVRSRRRARRRPSLAGRVVMLDSGCRLARLAMVAWIVFLVGVTCYAAGRAKGYNEGAAAAIGAAADTGVTK